MAGPDGIKDAMKRGLVAFLVVDAIFVLGGVALYFGILQPQMTAMEQSRDAAVRANLAMTARIRAVEGRLALASGDKAGAETAAAAVRAQVEVLGMRIPAANTSETAEVRSIGERAAHIGDEITLDPELARKDFEEIEARLAVLYPVPALK